MYTNIDTAFAQVRDLLNVDFLVLLDIYDNRIPEINKILEDTGRPTFKLDNMPVSCANNLMQAVLYYEYCVRLDIPCSKQHRSLWQCLSYDTSTSSAEQVFRTQLVARHAVPVILKNGIETINWYGIVTNAKDRRDRRLLSGPDFDNVIAQQDDMCFGYITEDDKRIHCAQIVKRGNGNTEQGHLPGRSDTVVAQCRSCNRAQANADRRKGLYTERTNVCVP